VWRASISTHSFYAGIDIGRKFEEQARQMLSGVDPDFETTS
jgi:hypothetical protein